MIEANDVISNGPALKLAEDGTHGREMTTILQLETCATYTDSIE